MDSQNRLINSAGRLVNHKGDYVDKDQKVVNKEGYLIDAQKRPLDKDGKVARDMTTAVKGNNEPHENLFSPALKSKIHSWQGKEPAPSSPKTSTVAEVAQRLADADKLVKSGVISKWPGYGQLAREGGITAGITGVVSAPINVAAYSGSVLAGEAIKAAYNPAPLTPPPPVAPKVAGQPAGSPEAPSAKLQTEEDVALQALYPQINKAQVSAFAAANLSIALKFGDDEKGYIPDPSWPPDALGRLESIERLLDFAEEHTHGLAEENRVHFRAYVRKEALPEGAAGFAAQVETIERRIAEIQLSHDEVLAKLGKLKPKQEPS
ncbi:hypothetical protein AZH11_05860 [Pseudomonas simiae]|nr:hypothetical protein AZH11_05860 [Pseudomonas simiae]